MTYIIDRIEDGIAVMECKSTGEIIEIPKADLPKNAREGQILQTTEDGFVVDKEATKKRRDEMRERLNKILNK